MPFSNPFSGSTKPQASDVAREKAQKLVDNLLMQIEMVLDALSQEQIAAGQEIQSLRTRVQELGAQIDEGAGHAKRLQNLKETLQLHQDAK